MKKLVFSFFLFISLSSLAQNVDTSDYKYIVVASNFGFLKSADEYQTSSLTKFLLQKKGFEVFLDTEDFPEELSKNKCLALKATVLDNSNAFTSKNRIQLTDCSGKIVYTSEEGKSKEKNYKRSYQEAIRNAFDTMTDFNYSYQPKKEAEVTYKIDNVQYKEEVVYVSEANQYKNPKELAKYSFVTIKNGFQIIDNQNIVLFTALKSTLQDIYILKDKSGVLYKKDGVFMVEYYEKDELKTAIFKVPF